MFKSAATKIAHNSTLPALAINQELRPLQDLITAEKAVILSLQRLATDLSKASEALKSWGLGEGDDLGDILNASATVLTHFTSALSQYASHGHSMRELLKSIRTREENLDELKRRRRNVGSKADAAEKKLNKMNPENKNLVTQTELLNRLRDEIRGLDVEIMKDEAAIGDFKRSATRTWVGLKFGGLIECCEKGVIAGEYGKLIISEIPDEQTQPGLPRNPYLSHSRIGDLVAEAHRCVNEVRLSTVPSTSQPPQQLPQVPHVSDSPFLTQGGFSPSPYQPQHRFTDSYGDDPARRNFEQLPPAPGPRIDSPLDSPILQSPQHHYSNSLSNAVLPSSLSGRRVDEFGSPIGPADNTGGGGGGGGRFATFPVKARSGSTSAAEGGQYPLLTTPDHAQSDSFSSAVAQALTATSSGGPEPNSLSQPGRFSKDEPAPSYEASVDLEQSRLAGSSNDSNTQQSRQQSDHIEEAEEGVEESHLAYMNEQVDNQPASRHVRFARDDTLPPTPQQPPSSSEARPELAGPQARLARLLQGEDPDQNNGGGGNGRSLDAAAAREVAVELNTPASSVTGDAQQQQQQQAPPVATYATSPTPSSPSSPARATYLERAPTYTEKPTSYHNQYGVPLASESPVGAGSSPVSQQQYSSPPLTQQHPGGYDYYDPQLQYQQHAQAPLMSTSPPPLQSYQSPRGGMPPNVYPATATAGHGQGQGQEEEFYNPYGDETSTTAGGVPQRMASPLQQPPSNYSPVPQSPAHALPSGAYTPPSNPMQSSPPPRLMTPTLTSPGDNDAKPRSPLYERPPNAPYMAKAPSMGDRSTSSLGSLTPSGGGGGGGGGGKISAAAFKRPAPRLGSNTMSSSSGSPFSTTTPPPGQNISPLKVNKRQTPQGAGEEPPYDYIGGYMSESREGEGENEGEGTGGDVGAGVGTYYYNGPGGAGGGQGKFAADVEK